MGCGEHSFRTDDFWEQVSFKNIWVLENRLVLRTDIYETDIFRTDGFLFPDWFLRAHSFIKSEGILRTEGFLRTDGFLVHQSVKPWIHTTQR